MTMLAAVTVLRSDDPSEVRFSSSLRSIGYLKMEEEDRENDDDDDDKVMLTTNHTHTHTHTHTHKAHRQQTDRAHALADALHRFDHECRDRQLSVKHHPTPFEERPDPVVLSNHRLQALNGTRVVVAVTDSDGVMV
jgi:hypothetical protein